MLYIHVTSMLVCCSCAIRTSPLRCLEPGLCTAVPHRRHGFRRAWHSCGLEQEHQAELLLMSVQNVVLLLETSRRGKPEIQHWNTRECAAVQLPSCLDYCSEPLMIALQAAVTSPKKLFIFQLSCVSYYDWVTVFDTSFTLKVVLICQFL